MENAECLDCHSDDSLARTREQGISDGFAREAIQVSENRFQGSVHSLNGIVCVDCHADIEELNYDGEVVHNPNLEPLCCTTCHEEEGEAFMSSAHAQARSKGITMLCYACHDYHYVTPQGTASVAERGNSMCLQCHNPSNSHEWLPQKTAHFDFVECTACHAPGVPHHLHLTFYDLVSKASLSCNDVTEVLEIKPEEFSFLVDSDQDGLISDRETDDLVLMLRQKGLVVVLHAELVAELNPLVHRINKVDAERDCRKCHSPDTEFFESVNFVVENEDGSLAHHEVYRSVLESYHTSHFYALGGTRIRMLDKIGIALIAGGACVVMGHFTVRVLTVPWRRRNRKDGNS